MNELYEESLRTVIALDKEIWHEQLTEATIERWTEQFTGQINTATAEQLLALAMLSQFMIFGKLEFDVLCRALYNEHVWYPIVSEYRRTHNHTMSVDAVDSAVRDELDHTIVVGPGNAAESGAHLLYQFRVANDLPLKLFVSPVQLLQYGRRKLRSIRRIILLDDLCGSGGSAERFYLDLIKPLRRRGLYLKKPQVHYLTLFSTEEGLEKARQLFDASTAMVLDASYRAFGHASRYFRHGTRTSRTGLNIREAESILRHYGQHLWRSHPLGYRNGQLLLGFGHNIPNNTLPVFWSTAGDPRWQPLVMRYGKRWNW